MKKVFMLSLGCSKNQVDAEVILGMLAERKYQVVFQPTHAEIIIVNTCGFIESAKEESIEEILNMSAYKTEGVCEILIVTGCLSQRYQEELMQELPEVDLWLGINAWKNISAVIEEFYAGKSLKISSFSAENELAGFADQRYDIGDQFSRYIKVADGCRNRCTYCAIPIIRGDFRSRSMASIIAETQKYISEGVKEINFIAQDTTSYGVDIYGKESLSKLLSNVSLLDGDFWLRILYCYPKYLTDDVINLIADSNKICKYIDLPLQHIHDDILKKMNRKDSAKEIRNLLDKLKSKMPDVALRTTFILGFPGETEEHFETLYNFLQEYSFTQMGAFPYSPEDGTQASLLQDRVAKDIVEERYHRLMSLQSQISESENKKMIGKTLRLLAECDANEDGCLSGRTYREAPEVDGKVYVDGASNVKKGEFIEVCIDEGYAYDLSANKV